MKKPPIVLPFVSWPGASPADRTRLLELWANVILKAGWKVACAPQVPKPKIEIIKPGTFPPRPEQTARTPNPFCEWYDDCCRSFSHPAPPAIGRRIRYKATSSYPYPGEWGHICEKCFERLEHSTDEDPWEWEPAEKPGLFLAWKKSAKGNYWVKVRDTHIVVFKRDDHLWCVRLQRDGHPAKYLKHTDEYVDRWLDALEKSFGKPPDCNNREALLDFTFADFMDAQSRDPIIVAARLEEERDRANGFAGYEADV